MIDLGSLGGPGNRWGSDFSVALGVNSLDQVVGYTYLPAVGDMPIQQVAFLWYQTKGGAGQMVNLNNLIDKTGRNYLVFSATAINDNGQIAGTAYGIMRNGSVRAVLLTPMGELAMTEVVNNTMKKDKQRLWELRKVGERHSGGRPASETSNVGGSYVAGALECETDKQIASNSLEGQIRHQSQILDLPSRNQI